MADTLREFLVAVGFKVDNASYSRFNKAIGDATKNVQKLDKSGLKGLSESIAAFGRSIGVVGATVAGAAALIAESTRSMVEDLNKLYLASNLTGATVANIDALRFGAQRVGVAADTAQAALQAFSLSMYANPGGRSLLDALGIPGKDDAEKLQGFFRWISQQPKMLQGIYASSYGSMLGLPLDVIKREADNIALADRTIAEHNQLMRDAGLNEDALAVQANELTRNWQRMHEELRTLGMQIDSAFVPSMIESTHWINQQVESAIKWIGAEGGVPGIIRQISDSITGSLGPMQDYTTRMDLMGNSVTSFLTKSGATTGNATLDSYIGLGNQPNALDKFFSSASGKNWVQGSADAFKTYLDLQGIMFGSKENKQKALANFSQDLKQMGVDFNANPVLPYSSAPIPGASGSPAAGAGSAPVSGGSGGSVHDRLAEGMAYFQAQGLPRYAASAIMAQFLNENSTLDPDVVNASGHRGIGQWDSKVRQQNFAAWSGRPMEGSSYEDQLQYSWHELLTTHQTALAKILMAGQSGGASAAGFAGTDYEVPVLPSHTQDYFAQQQRRAATADQIYHDPTVGSSDKNVSVTQDIDINIHGGSDSAEQTARAAHQEFQRGNADTARNLNNQLR